MKTSTTANETKINKMLAERVNVMLKDSAINKVYQSKATKEEAKDWIFMQALVTLMYSHEERMQMQNKVN